MSAPHLLILGEKPRRALAGAMARQWDVTVARDDHDALELLTSEVFDVALLAEEDGGRQVGADFVQAAKRVAPHTELVIVFPERSPHREQPREAFGCLEWPLDVGLAVKTLQGALERRRLLAEIEHLRAELRRAAGINDLASWEWNS